MTSQNSFQFIQESVSVNVHGKASIASTARAKRTPAQIQEDTDQALLNVFGALSENHFSLRTFLLAAFGSSHERISSLVNGFYAKAGPAAIVRLWGRNLESNQCYDSTFTMEAIDVVIGRVQADLEHAIKNKSFRHPANSICRKTIRAFSLDGIRSLLADSAPYLTQLLSKLIPNKPGSVSGWRPPSDNPHSLATDNPIAPIETQPTCLATSHLGSNWNLASGQDPVSDSDSASDVYLDMEWDSEWEDEGDPKPNKDSHSFIVTVGCMLLYMKSQQSNCFQMMMGKCHTKLEYESEAREAWQS